MSAVRFLFNVRWVLLVYIIATKDESHERTGLVRVRASSHMLD